MSKVAEASAQRWELVYRCAITGGVPRRSLLVAVVVGSLLNLINQGDRIFSGQPLDFAKLALTYLVPYSSALMELCRSGSRRTDAVGRTRADRRRRQWRRAHRLHSPALR